MIPLLLVLLLGAAFWIYITQDRVPLDQVPETAVTAPESFVAPVPTPNPDPEDIRQTKLNDLRQELNEATRSGDYEKTATLAKSVLKMEPDDAEAWCHLGWISENKGEWDQALERYDKSVNASDENKPFYLYRRACLYRKQANFPAAIADLEEAVRLDPTSIGMNNFLSIFRIQAGQEDSERSIVASYEKAGLSTQGPLWLMRAAALAMHDGDFDKAALWLWAFKSRVPEGIYVRLTSDPFFDPYRSNPKLTTYFLRTDPTLSPPHFTQ